MICGSSRAGTARRNSNQLPTRGSPRVARASFAWNDGSSCNSAALPDYLVRPVPEEADPFLLVGIAAGHDLVRLTADSNRVSRAGSKVVVRRSSLLRVDLATSTTRTAGTSSTFASAESRSSVRSTVKSSASGGRSRAPVAPKAPLSFPPFPPNAPAPPSSGVSSTGGGGGNGLLLTFSAFLAAFVLFGIHRLLRRVHWSDLRMPGRGAALPWKPG